MSSGTCSRGGCVELVGAYREEGSTCRRVQEVVGDVVRPRHVRVAYVADPNSVGS